MKHRGMSGRAFGPIALLVLTLATIFGATANPVNRVELALERTATR